MIKSETQGTNFWEHDCTGDSARTTRVGVRNQLYGKEPPMVNRFVLPVFLVAFAGFPCGSMDNLRCSHLSTGAATLIGVPHPYSAAIPQEPEREPKRFEWVDQRAGDCHLSGVLTLFPDGKARWAATSWTDHTVSGDIWHETLQVLDGQKHPLFGFGVWDSDRMFVGDRDNWSKESTFPAGFFDNAAGAESSGSC